MIQLLKTQRPNHSHTITLFQKLTTTTTFPPKTFTPNHHLLSPSPITLPSLLQRHALILTSGNSTNPFLASKLISLYSSFHLLSLSSLIFSSLPPPSRDAFLWNSIIQSHYAHSAFSASLSLFKQMLQSGHHPDQFTLPILASSCAELRYIGFGMYIHGMSIKLGIWNVGSSLVYLYSKCGVVGDALKVFDEMPVRDVVAWTAVVVGCVSNGEWELGLFWLREMPGSLEVVSQRALESGMQACGSLQEVWGGSCLHGFAVKIGFEGSPSFRSMILSMYSKCESLEEARWAFRELPEKDIVSWTSIVGVHARKGLIRECLDLFGEMTDSGIRPDGVFLSCLLMGFAKSSNVYGVKALHDIILRRNMELDKLVYNSLISVYFKLELLDDSAKVFDLIGYQDSESWNLMVSEYVKRGFNFKCLDLFREMHSVGLSMNSIVQNLVSVISSCSQLGALLLGQSIHCYIIKNSVQEDESISNSLVEMYGKCGRLDLARRIFDGTNSIVNTWNTLISVYAHNGHSEDALSLFDQMCIANVNPNSTTLMSVLSACSHIAALHRGKHLHEFIKESGLEFDVSLSTALIDMYAKCGELETSRLLFDSMIERDAVAYNVMISAYGIHGDGKQAMYVFEEMERKRVMPNGVTFLALLSACSHGGLVEQGKILFDRMRKSYSISLTLKHYACMVDLLGRSGNLSEAEELVLSMPIKPDGAIWGTLLGACNMHKEAEMGERIAKRALELDPENDGYYTLMSNMYGCYERWEEVKRLREMMKGRGVKKRAGWSSVEIEGRVNVFVVEEKSLLQSEKISMVLEAMGRQMEEWSSYMEIKNTEI